MLQGNQTFFWNLASFCGWGASLTTTARPHFKAHFPLVQNLPRTLGQKSLLIFETSIPSLQEITQVLFTLQTSQVSFGVCALQQHWLKSDYKLTRTRRLCYDILSLGRWPLVRRPPTMLLDQKALLSLYVSHCLRVLRISMMLDGWMLDHKLSHLSLNGRSYWVRAKTVVSTCYFLVQQLAPKEGKSAISAQESSSH